MAFTAELRNSADERGIRLGRVGGIPKGYEAKDLQIGVPFYLAQGIKDIVVFDPYTLKVLHFKQMETRETTSPVEIVLECGCVCTV